MAGGGKIDGGNDDLERGSPSTSVSSSGFGGSATLQGRLVVEIGSPDDGEAIGIVGSSNGGSNRLKWDPKMVSSNSDCWGFNTQNL